MAARGRGSAAGGSRAPLVAGAAFLYVAVLLLAATPAAEAGTTYFVGDAAGWGGARTFDYAQWAASKTFHAGDILVFKYNATLHDVAWVSKGGYRKCIVSPKGRARVYRTGYDAVTLPRGTHYFICGAPGHCSPGGMKLAVKVC